MLVFFPLLGTYRARKGGEGRGDEPDDSSDSGYDMIIAGITISRYDNIRIIDINGGCSKIYVSHLRYHTTRSSIT